MNRKVVQVLKQLRRSLCTKQLNPKFDFSADLDVVKGIDEGFYKHRQHPGSMNIKPIALPKPLVEAVKVVLQDHPWKSVSQNAKVLIQYIWSRHPPSEVEELKMKQHSIEERVKSREHIDPDSPDIPEEEKQRLDRLLKSKVSRRMKKEVYSWNPIKYTSYKCLLYLVGRLAPDFGTLVQIMSEIKKRDMDYRPHTMLDFGSGVGTGMWALDEVWPTVCQEVVCVDSCSEMNTLADKLLRGGDLEKPRLVREGKTFFKQFLPLSNLLKYDMVISSRSLFELPDMANRLRTLDILWRKTSGYLILVEAGTNAGYRLVQEARDYIVELSRQAQEEGRSNPEGYVFAPCTHDKFCPKYLGGSNIPCNFESSYWPLSLGKDQTSKKDRFTYVIIKQGKRIESTEKSWPRLIEPPMNRNKHVICRTCTPSGTLREFTATKSKHTRECYRICRSSKWGDLLPIDFPEVHDNVNNQDSDNQSKSEECIQN